MLGLCITDEGCSTQVARVSSALVHVLCKCWKLQQEAKSPPQKSGLFAFVFAATGNCRSELDASILRVAEKGKLRSPDRARPQLIAPWITAASGSESLPKLLL